MRSTGRKRIAAECSSWFWQGCDTLAKQRDENETEDSSSCDRGRGRGSHGGAGEERSSQEGAGDGRHFASGHEGGRWAAPAATIGVKPDQPWSTTSVAAGVDSKPQAGSAVTRVGEIVDFSCYIQLGKHGEKHRACGQKCVLNGQPIGLLTRDGALYMLMPEEHDPRRDGGVD